jgi:pimeloyl-ACP methyl ester carboxylesterase
MLDPDDSKEEKAGNVVNTPLKNSKRSTSTLNTVRLRVKFLLISVALFILFTSFPGVPNHLAVVRGLRALCGDTSNELVSSTVVAPKPATCRNVDENSPAFWRRIRVSRVSDSHINWQSCYKDKECARILLPLDYLNEGSETGPWATIAMVRVPAKISPRDPAYGGPVLVNPGGPGGSGAMFVAGMGDALQQVVGEEFDIVGFDPRGIGQSTPRLNVFPDQAEGTEWMLKQPTAPLLNSSTDAVARFHAYTSVYNSLAAERMRYDATNASTASVARDMLEITKAHGRDKIQYWGFSYGSILGATYAAMFPNNVGRLIIDGVMDTKNYYDTLWDKNLADTDTGLRMYFEACADAGPELCGIWEPTTAEVSARYDSILQNLKRRPLAVPSNSTTSSDLDYGIVDYATVKSVVFAYLYSPYPQVPGKTASAASTLSFYLSEIEKGNGLPLWNVWKGTLPHFVCTCPPGAPGNVPATLSPDALMTYMCGDGRVVDQSIEEMEQFLKGINSTFADVWGRLHIACADWKIRPKYRFTGPYGGNTSYPLLIIGNIADPVTPLESAHAVARDFNGSSVVLTQKSAGHCSLAAPSLCTAKAIHAYFRNGTLPEPGTTCDIEGKIFGEQFNPLLDSLVGEERSMMNAWGKLNEVYSESYFGLARAARNVLVY